MPCYQTKRPLLHPFPSWLISNLFTPKSAGSWGCWFTTLDSRLPSCTWLVSSSSYCNYKHPSFANTDLHDHYRQLRCLDGTTRTLYLHIGSPRRCSTPRRDCHHQSLGSRTQKSLLGVFGISGADDTIACAPFTACRLTSLANCVRTRYELGAPSPPVRPMALSRNPIGINSDFYIEETLNGQLLRSSSSRGVRGHLGAHSWTA